MRHHISSSSVPPASTGAYFSTPGEALTGSGAAATERLVEGDKLNIATLVCWNNFLLFISYYFERTHSTRVRERGRRGRERERALENERTDKGVRDKETSYDLFLMSTLLSMAIPFECKLSRGKTLHRTGDLWHVQQRLWRQHGGRMGTCCYVNTARQLCLHCTRFIWSVLWKKRSQLTITFANPTASNQTISSFQSRLRFLI